MSDDKHRMPTTIGSELAVTTDDGTLCGFVGETKGGDAGIQFYARPCHDSNMEAGTKWFASREEATAYLKQSIG